MLPTITTILASADKAAQNHEKAMAAHQAAHERYALERASQPPATPHLAPGAGRP